MENIRDRSDFLVVFLTCPSEEEASRIAHFLVENRLAACINITSPIRSIYRWEGKIFDEKEYLLIIKTKSQSFEELEKEIKSLHSYTNPEIIGLPIIKGSSYYLKWLEEMVR